MKLHYLSLKFCQPGQHMKKRDGLQILGNGSVITCGVCISVAKVGLAEMFQSRNEPMRQAARDMTAAEKTAYIRDHDLAAFKELLA